MHRASTPKVHGGRAIHCTGRHTHKRCQHTSIRAEPQRTNRDLDRLEAPPAPPVGITPPPPPPSSPSTEDSELFPRRRDILAALIIGSGLWWYRLADLRPTYDIRATKAGNPYMVTKSGDVFVLFKSERNDGKVANVLMVDLSGNMFFDSGDPQQGWYIIDRQRNVLNARLGPDGDRKIVTKLVGDLNDVRPFPITKIGDVYAEGGTGVVWAFKDSKPLIIDPAAFLQTTSEGEKVLALPSEYVEGVIKLQEKDKGWFNFGRKSDDMGGPLRRGIE